MSGYAKDQPEGFSNRIEKVAIVGAGGRMGRHLAEHLIKTGKHIVTAITRPDSTNELPEGLQVVRVDYSGDDDAALVEALRGQQVLIITMAVMAPGDTISKLVRAAAKAGVAYVLPNWFGGDPENDKLQTDTLMGHLISARKEVKDLGVSSYLLLACSFWYEFSLGGGPNRYGFDFKNRSLVWFDGGDVAINTSTWPQCARAVASLLSLKELPEDENDRSPSLSQFRNSPVYISSFLLNQRAMFESVKRVTGTTDADWTMTHESAEQRFKDGQAAMQKGDMQGFPKLLYSRMFFPNGDGDYQSKRGLHNDLLGLPQEDLDEYTAIAVRMGETEEVLH
ncbi:putative oxidoreductase CipA-like protein [Massariosphaeria phaeospora]|uniref:Putative oxidoreductase CipA-like protein n=1 Tax=Massariosphaeria phaeospora TaxID=100035 RepID=A0A7C8MMX7_9PLEO|nr:putative oxidoreductase CipA-like protein [Massariosphaeria phaeospora]